MNNTKYTFWRLIQEFSINIPIIQRDYAQGRNTDKINDIRKSFIDNLYDAININTKTLDFDFIYGSVNVIENKKYFIPLDGQQRLTTLYLLHWYLSVKENREDILKLLAKFSYETRISSSDFCKSLVESGVSVLQNDSFDKISDIIRNSSWYYLSWDNDPTIKSMLVMLDAIHDKFKNAPNCVNKLIDIEEPVVKFQCIKIENFGLTDNLYIKMNARGKALTDFENFKAKFEQFLDDNHKSYQKIYSEKIDGVWTDLLWKYKEDEVIDKPFMRYFYFISEMLYFKNTQLEDKQSPFKYDNKNNPIVDYKLLEQVYKEEKNVRFLFNALNKIEEIGGKCESVFSGNEYKKGKVALFVGSDKTNLFTRCLKALDFGIYERVLLYTIIYYLVEIGSKEIEDNLKDCVRVVRNLLLRVRWQNKLKFDSNLRYNYLPNQLSDICNIIISEKNCYETLTSNVDFKGFTPKKSITSEIEKAKFILSNPELKNDIFELEDFKFFKGSIHNIDIENKKNSLQVFNKAIREIWNDNNSDSLIARAMLTIGDYLLWIGNSALGATYYLGNDPNWYTILSNMDYEKGEYNFTDFIQSYIDNDFSMKEMIRKWLEEKEERDWLYYFVKYSEMTSTNNNLYAWESDFEVRNLTKLQLNGWHINPYVRTVAMKINKKSICDVDNCYSNTREESPLKLKHNIKLYCEEEGWKIVKSKRRIFDKKILKDFTIENDYLKPDENRDMIEVAVAFSKVCCN